VQTIAKVSGCLDVLLGMVDLSFSIWRVIKIEGIIQAKM
jgi:hypothetical protein